MTPSARPRRRFFRRALVASSCAVLVAGCTHSVTGVEPGTIPAPSCAFQNPVAVGADPWVIRHAGIYYLIQSRDGGIWITSSRSLSGVASGTAVRVWTPPDTGWNRTNVWAPELHWIGARWYIYYAAGRSGPPYIAQRAGVLASVTADPQGAYTDRGMLYTGDSVSTGSGNVWAIDLTVGDIGGQLYAVWSGWDQNATTDRTPQNLYIARMSNPWTIATNRVRIASPVASWEKGTELDLEEGPEFLSHANATFIVYSTRESWLPAYQLGELRLTGADPLDPASYEKSGPVFSGTSYVYGVGHASFTVSPDSTQDWIVYHSKMSTTPGWERDIRMQPFTWNSDGSPNFGTPVPSGTSIQRPSGECTAG